MVLRKLGLSSKICADNKAEIRFDRAVNSVHPGYFLVFMLGLAPALAAATYEVAQQDSAADDKGPGTAKQPWKTISRAAEKVGPGDVVIIRSGTYHERVHVKASGTAESPIRIEAAPGEHVVVTGADHLTNWRKADGQWPIYSVGWPHRYVGWNPHMTHPGDDYHRVIGRCEQVWVDRNLVRQVLDLSHLAPGSFYVDITNKSLLLWDIGGRDPNKAHVEASVRQEVLRTDGNHVRIRGLWFRYAANMAQHGAVVLAGRCNTMEDCVVEAMNASGATFFGEDTVVRRCIFRDNGQLGFGASRAHRLLFTECLVENNNTKGYDRGWEAGGDKLVLCRDAVLERSRFLRNRGTGIWFDIGNTNCTVRQCLIADNEDAGIFYEISFRLVAHDNVIVGNGFASTAGAWGAQAGVSLSSSPGCVIERNLMAGNREGFNFREQTRSTPTIEDNSERAVWNHDQLIRHNLIVRNRDAQVWGWFDVKDNRHWAAAGQGTRPPATNGEDKPGNIAAPYVERNAKEQPQGLTLKKLHLQFDGNVYFAAPGQGWFHWGPSWTRHKHYTSLIEFQSELRIDTQGQVRDPGFADMIQRDYRLKPEAMESIGACYPQGPVPGVTLGTLK